MEQLSLHANIKVNSKLTHSVTYTLTYCSSLYGIECFIEGSDHDNPNNYCYIQNITPNEDFAKELLYILAKDEVLPIHIGDIIQDIYS